MISYQLSVIRGKVAQTCGSFSHKLKPITDHRSLITAAVLLAAPATLAQDFDEQREAVSAAIEAQSEEVIIKLLATGIEEGKPTQAATLTEKWLRQNLAENPRLLYYAGRASELSGDWSGAAALYQQYLEKTDLEDEHLEDAILAYFTLRINYLEDEGSAFAFSKKAGDRLLKNRVARQFDRWFLDFALERKDYGSVAKRLKALIDAKVDNNLLSALHEADFHALLRWLETVDVSRDKSSTWHYEMIRELAAVINFDEELKLKLDGMAAACHYFVAKRNGDSPEVPLAATKRMLDKYPGQAPALLNVWSGGRNYRDSAWKESWGERLIEKVLQITEAEAKMAPLDKIAALPIRGDNYYNARKPQPFSSRKTIEFIMANKDLLNSKAAAGLGIDWRNLSDEQAKEIAPILAKNPSADAAMVRAIAGSGGEYAKAIELATGPEAWRLPPDERTLSEYGDHLWHWYKKPGGNDGRNAATNPLKALAKQHVKVNANDPLAKRQARFDTLWADFQSASPKIPGVRYQLLQVLSVSPEVFPKLLQDFSLAAQVIVREVVEKGVNDAKGPLSRDERERGLSTNVYDPSILRKERRHGGYFKRDSNKHLRAPHGLEPALHKAVAARLAKGEIVPWLTLAWINAQYQEDNDAQKELAAKLSQSPAFAKLPYEVRYGMRQWFGSEVLPESQQKYVDASSIRTIFGKVWQLPEEPTVEQAEEALKAAIAGMKASPVRRDFAGINHLERLRGDINDPKLRPYFIELADPLRSYSVTRNMANWVKVMIKVNKDDPVTLHRIAAYCWRITQVAHHSHREMMEFPGSMVDKHPSVAATYARGGLQVIASHRRGHTWFKKAEDVPRLKAARGKALTKMGLATIPVPKTAASYPIYKSQADWLIGNEDSAWQLVDKHWEQLTTVQRQLAVPYLIWLVERIIYSRDEVRQQELLTSLLTWAKEPTSPLTPAEKISLEIAFGDVAVQRGNLEKAREIFAKAAKNKAYDGLMQQHRAALRMVRVDRIAKNFDAGLQTLMDLELERIDDIWSEIRYARSEIYYDMEEYGDASEEIAGILAREPNHAEAKILEGKVRLKRKKLMEATEVEVGSTSEQDQLVPGENLKVTLTDPTLAVSGAGTEIEVEVWATSGDKERFFLRQFGDEKTKFRGEVATVLGAPTPGDKTLQVVGDDEVFYAYSERFRKRMNNVIPENRGGPIKIASDATLFASARKLLTAEEQAVADAAARMAEIRRRSQGRESDSRVRNALQAEIAASLDEKLSGGGGVIGEEEQAEEGVDVESLVKPGNPIHIRVIDHDRSRSGTVDELAVSLESSSGDRISRVVLKETGTHTGWFEGSVPTRGAQAMAFARSTETGRNPNMVISPREDYPAWRPTQQPGQIPEFTVDLNDNAKIDKLTIVASENDAKLTGFTVYTGMNHGDLTPVARYPKNPIAVQEPTKPSIVVMHERDQHYGKVSVYDFNALRAYFADGWIGKDHYQAHAQNVPGPSQAFPKEVLSAIDWKKSSRWDNPCVAARFQAYFYEPKKVTRRFSLELGPHKINTKDKNQARPGEFLVAINGRQITGKEGKMTGAVNLPPGVHKLEIWASGWLNNIGFGRDVRLKANLEDTEQMVACPDSFFDPATFPPGVMGHQNKPATIEAGKDGGEFTVKFAPESRTRLIRLAIPKHRGAVPAINKLRLTAPDGKKLLPVEQDYAELTKNQTLEILTGDRVSIRYLDDRFVTKGKARHERALSVAFTSGRVEFADMEPRMNELKGELEEFYEQLLRFRHNEPLSLAIRDADMDVSVEPDTVKVTIDNGAGATKTLTATETGPSTGLFKVIITPVPGAATGGKQFQVPKGGSIVATYRDNENPSPGIPVDRVGTIRHADYAPPELWISHATVTPLEITEETPNQPLYDGFEILDERELARLDAKQTRDRNANVGRIRPRWKIQNELTRTTEAPEGGIAVVPGHKVFFQMRAPQEALRMSSKIKVYAQTDSGRQLRAPVAGTPYDTSVPGTVAMRGAITLAKGAGVIRGFRLLNSYHGHDLYFWGSKNKADDLFAFSLPLILGPVPSHGVLEKEERVGDKYWPQRSLVVRPGDTVHFGFKYEDASGKAKWLTTKAKVVTHPVLDVLEEDYREPRETAYVGETIHLRVVDLGGDRTDARDAVAVFMQAKSGAKERVELRESGPHTGIFKGEYQLSYKQDGDGDEFDARTDGFPVIYGDKVGIRYTDANGLKTPPHYLEIKRGADGSIKPFSKVYGDAEIAMRTQFSLAEGYLELAKRHRKQGETEVAAREYDRAKQLLAKAMNQFRDPETRAHAQYLLGNLTLEEGDVATDPEVKETRYRAALSRFMTVTGTYPDTLPASKAQFRIASVYEKLGEPEVAAQEYVKLAYKYPESEHLAVAMAKLGTHFQRKAAGYEAKSAQLLAQVDDKDAQFEGTATQTMAYREYVKAATIFGRMQERFPDHELAGKAGLLSGQAYLRAKRYDPALEAFSRVIKNESYDGPNVRAQAMFWAGDCYQNTRQLMAAYSVYKRLTFDFPESKWASYARAKLSDGSLLKLETDLELQRLEEGR